MDADKQREVLETLESAADVWEAQAKRFADLAAPLVSNSPNKQRLEELSRDATQRAGKIRRQIRLLKDQQ